MRRMIIGALLIATASTSLMAQRGQRGIPIEKMKESLELTDAQMQQLEAIQLESREQMEALRAKEFKDMETRRNAMLEIRESSRQKVEAILTQSQQQKMEALEAERKERFEERREKRQVERKEMMKERKEKMKARHTEAKAYRAENIRPVMQEQRTKLDESISKKDKKKINELRAFFKTQKENRIAQMKAAKEKGERPGKEEMEAWKEAHEKSAEVIEARELAEKYAKDIEALMSEIEGKRGEWESDMKEIMKPEEGTLGKERMRHPRHMKRHDGDKANPHEYEDHERFKGHKGHRGKRGMRGETKENRQMHRHVRFLMMDPNAPDDGMVGQPQSSTIKEMSVYPNPASNDVNLSFELGSDSKTRIELRDESGNLVKTFKDQNFKSGEVTSRLDLTDIQTGVYYVVIITEDGSKQTSQVIINK
jgi:hypothetical protein